MRTVLVALAFAAAAKPAAGEGLEHGWWIVAGSFRQNGTDRNDALIAKASDGLRQCGLTPFYDFSFKFSSFASNYDVVVTGPFSSKADADATLGRARRCIPSAYLKNARYLGK